MTVRSRTFSGSGDESQSDKVPSLRLEDLTESRAHKVIFAGETENCL